MSKQIQIPVKIKGVTFVFCEVCGVLLCYDYAQKTLLDAFPDQLGSGRIIGENDVHYFCDKHRRHTSSSSVPNFEWTHDLTGNGYWKELPREEEQLV